MAANEAPAKVIAVFIGRAPSVDRVRSACLGHARWLERPVEEARWEADAADAQVSVFCAWDPATTDDHYRYLAMCTGDGCKFDDRLGDSSPRISLHLHPARAELRAEAPIGSAVQLQHARLDGGWLLTDDIRLLRRVSDPPVDPVGVYGLLKIGAIPAPYTIFEGVARIRPGTAIVYDGLAGGMREEHPWREAVGRLASIPAAASLEEARERVIGAVDRALESLPEEGSVMFSGGVDSTLIAARLAAMGRSDVKLAHMRFAYLPEETRVAQALADHLRLPMTTLTYDPASAAELLPLIGHEWPFPFNDSSVVPTRAAALFALSVGAPAVAEGTAAGFLAGPLITAWQRRGRRLPRPLRSLVARGIRSSGAWRLGGRLEKVARLAGRRDLPMAASYVVKNALDGIAYDVPPNVLDRLGEAVVGPLDGMPTGPESIESLGLTSLVTRSAGRYAPKVMGPLSLRGASGLHAFMNQTLIETELGAGGEWTDRENKAMLKSQLARQVPPELVYRPKSSFTPRIEDILAVAEVRRAVAEAIDDGAPLAPFVRPAPVRLLLRRAAEEPGAGSVVAGRAGRWLWALAFTHLWLRDTDFGPDQTG